MMEATELYFAYLIISLVVSFAMIVVIISFITKLFGNSKSREYRELLVDMYVVGMIKKFASEDKIDLIKELKEYAKIEKRSRLSEKGLSNVIEDELKEKISKTSEEHIAKS